MGYQPPSNYDPQNPAQQGSYPYQAYPQPYGGNPSQLPYYPPPQSASPGTNKDVVETMVAKDDTKSRLASIGQHCGYFGGLPLLIAIIFGRSLTAIVLAASLGLVISVTGIVLSARGLSCLLDTDRKTARRGLTVSIIMTVVLLVIVISALLLINTTPTQ